MKSVCICYSSSLDQSANVPELLENWKRPYFNTYTFLVLAYCIISVPYLKSFRALICLMLLRIPISIARRCYVLSMRVFLYGEALIPNQVKFTLSYFGCKRLFWRHLQFRRSWTLSRKGTNGNETREKNRLIQGINTFFNLFSWFLISSSGIVVSFHLIFSSFYPDTARKLNINVSILINAGIIVSSLWIRAEVWQRNFSW